MGGANLASSSFTRSRNRAISWSLAVGSVVTSGGGGGALLVLMVCTSQRCGEAVRLLRAPVTRALAAIFRRNQLFSAALHAEATLLKVKQHLAPVRH